MRFSIVLTVIILAAIPTALAADGISILGRVVDETGVAASAARIELHRASTSSFERGIRECCVRDDALPVAVVTTRDDGLFELLAPGPGAYEVHVRVSGHLRLVRRLGPVVEATELETAHLERLTEIQVTVVDPEGRPVPGARVRMPYSGFRDAVNRSESRGQWRPWERLTVTDDSGLAVVPVGIHEYVRLTAMAPGFLPSGLDRVMLLTEKTLRLGPGVTRVVETRDEASLPVADVLLRLYPTGPDEAPWLRPRPVGLTGEDGRLTVAAPAQGKLLLTAETATGLVGRVALGAPAEGDEGPVVLTLEPGPSLSGRVTDKATGRGIADAWVWEGERVARTSADGSYVLPLRGADAMVLNAVAPGYVLGSLSVRRPQESDVDAYDLALEPSAVLIGTVVDENDAAVAGAEVEILGQGLHPRAYVNLSAVMASARERGGGRYRMTRSRAGGGFRFSVAPEQTYALVVRKPGYLVTRVEARARDGEPVRVVLRRGRQGFGRVLDLDEQPVSGAEVRLWNISETSSRSRDSQALEATTDETGRFEIPDLPPERYDLRATASGFAPLAVEGLSVVYEPGESDVDLGTIILEPGARVAGRVVDNWDRPIEGVKISYDLWSSAGQLHPWDLATTEVTSDAEGSFVIGDLLVGEKLDLSLWHLDYAAAEAQGVECPTEDLLLVLKPTATVRGRVVAHDGAAVPGAQVVAHFRADDGGPLRRNTAARPDGSFELDYLGVRGVELEASAKGYRSSRVGLELEPGETVDGLVLRLEPGAVLQGTVYGPSGGPVADARISLWGFQRFVGDHGTSTDAQGQFRLEGLDLGPQQFYVSPPELPAVVRQFDVELGVNTVEVHIEQGYEVRGRVVDDTGLGLAGVRVGMARQSGSTDGDGAFVLEDVPAGVHTLWATGGDFAGGELSGVRVDGPIWDLEIEVHKGATLQGRILGLEEVSAANVQVMASSLERRFAAGRVDFDGRYRFSRLGPGKWTIRATHAVSGRTARGTVELEPTTRQAELDLEFVPGLVLSGVVSVDGRPEAGAAVRLQGQDVMAGGRQRTDYNGSFELHALRPGRYRMVVRGQDRSLLAVRQVELLGDEHVRIEIATGELGGQVVDGADGSGLDAARLALEPLDVDGAGETETSETDSRGAFRFSRLAEGSYLLRTERPGYAATESRVSVDSGTSNRKLTVALERTSGLVLQVRDAAGGSPDMVFVAASGIGPSAGAPVRSGRYLVTEGGRVRLTSLPPGTWQLLLRGRVGTATVSVTASAPGEVLPVVLPLETRLELSVPDLVASQEIGTVTIEGAGGPFVSVGAGGLQRVWPIPGGWTRIEGLPPGDWSVTVTSTAGQTWTGRVRATEGGGRVQLVLE